MANELKLRISAEGSEKAAADLRKVEEAAGRLSQTVKSVSSDSLDRLEQSSKRTAAGIDVMSSKMATMGHLAAALTIAPQFIGSLQSAGKALFDASAAAERLKTQLSFATGNAAQEMAYLAGLSNKLGLEFRSTAQAYAGFAAASRGTALEGQKTRAVFEAISKASAVMGLSTDQSSGALLAIQQMMSKGVVSAEEFRGQLGERMPMALQAGAKALGVTAAEFSKLMESGKIVSEDFLPKFAAAITEMLGDAPEKAANRLDAAANRMGNAWDTLKQRVGDAGVSRAIANDMNTLDATATAMSEAIEQSAKRGEGGFGQLASAAGVLIGRSALGGVASVAETVNGAVNLLSGGTARLSTNISLLPDNLRPVSEALAVNEAKLKSAQAEYAALAERVAKAPENIYIRSELAQLGLYIGRLKEAREQQALLAGQALPGNYGNEGRGAAQAKEADDAALAAAQKRGKAYAEMFDKLATPAEKASKAIREARESLGEFFTPEIEKRIRDSFIKQGAGTGKNDAAQIFAAEIKAAQDHAKTAVDIVQEKVKQQVLSERQGVEQILAAHNAGYVEQATLLKKQLAGTKDAGDRAKLKADIVALGNDAAIAAEKAASGLAKIDEAALKTHQTYMKGLGDEAASLLEKAKAAEIENAQIGMSADALATLTRARYDEQIALRQRQIDAIGNNETMAAEKFLIEQQVAALTRLRDAEIVRPKLREQAREWEKFTDQIGQSLTDSLYRAFEAGGSFGKNFAKTLETTLKASLAKLAINIAITTGSNALNSGINAVLGTSGSNGGSGTNYLGLASNASSMYNLANGTYLGYWHAAQAGYGLSGAEAAAAAQAYYQAGYYGTGAAIQAGNVAGTGSLGSASAGASGATGAAAGSMSLSAAAGYFAIIAAAFQLLTTSKTRYLDTSITGTLGPDGLTNGMIGDRYKYTGNLLDAGGTDLEWRPLTSDRAAYDEFYMQMRYGNYRNNAGALQSAGYLGDNLDPYTLQRSPYTQAQIDDAFSRYVADQESLDTRVNRTGSGETVATELEQGGALKAAFEAIYKGAKESLQKTADLFGDQSLGKALEGYVSQINIKTSGSITGAIASYADSLISGMGAAWLPTVDSLRATTEVEGKKITEAWSQTFQRLVSESVAVKDVFDLVGESLANLYGNNTDKILAASDAFVKLFGSIDTMNSSVNAYYDNFYSESEKQNRAWQSIEKSFSALGVATPKTREEFRRLVEAQDLATAAGQAAFKGLMDLQSGFARLTPAVDASAGTVSSLATSVEDLAAAAAENAAAIAESIVAGFSANYADATGLADRQLNYLRESAQLERSQREAALRDAAALERTRLSGVRAAASEQISLAKAMVSTLSKGVSDLRGEVTATAAGSAQSAIAWISQAAQAATSSGYLPDAEALSEAISAARGGLKDENFSSAFERDFQKLRLAGELDAISAVAGRQLPVAEQALKVAEDQLAKLEDDLEASLKALDYYDQMVDGVKKQIDALKGIDSGIGDLGGSLVDMANRIVAGLNSSLASINAGVAAQASAGTIDTKTAAAQLQQGGVPTDQWTVVGGKQIAISSQGAIAERSATGAVSITANNGWKGSLDDAKRIVAEAFYAMPAPDFYKAATSVGLSSTFIDAMYDFPAGTALAWAKSNNLPAFEVGTNRVPEDMLAVVHKDEAIIPAAFNPWAGGTGGSGSSDRLEKLVESLTAEVKRLQGLLSDGNRHAERTATVLDDAARGRQGLLTKVPA